MRDAVENQIKHFGQTPSQVSVLTVSAFSIEISMLDIDKCNVDNNNEFNCLILQNSY